MVADSTKYDIIQVIQLELSDVFGDLGGMI